MSTAADGRPTFVRPGFEFNGVWNAYQPASYREAFIRIRTLFLDEGATNAIWVWIPAWSDRGDLRIERSPLRDEWETVLDETWVANGS